jgi:hypothetical protein
MPIRTFPECPPTAPGVSNDKSAPEKLVTAPHSPGVPGRTFDFSYVDSAPLPPLPMTTVYVGAVSGPRRIVETLDPAPPPPPVAGLAPLRVNTLCPPPPPPPPPQALTSTNRTLSGRCHSYVPAFDQVCSFNRAAAFGVVVVCASVAVWANVGEAIKLVEASATNTSVLLVMTPLSLPTTVDFNTFSDWLDESALLGLRRNLSGSTGPYTNPAPVPLAGASPEPSGLHRAGVVLGGGA